MAAGLEDAFPPAGPPLTAGPDADGDGDADTDLRVFKLRRNGVTRSRKERRYCCSFCGESFTRKEHCRRHELGHRQQRPHACPLCGLTSSRKDVISRHVRVVHCGADKSALAPTNALVGAVDNGRPNPAFALLTTSLDAPRAGDDGTTLAAGAAAQAEPVLAETYRAAISTLVDSSSTSSTLDLDLDRSWQVAGLACVPAPDPDADASATLRPQMDFQLLDDAFFQWPLDEPFAYNLAWSDDATAGRPLPARDGDQGAAPDNGEYQSSGLFMELIPAEIEQARVNLQLFDVEHRLADFKFPTTYMAIRIVRGFFKHFSPHTPIVHPRTFSIGACPAPLLLAVMACGAVYVNEQEASLRLYHAALKLLSENEDLVVAGQRDPGFQLWEFQTRLLACEFGLFSGDARLQRQARFSFAKLYILGREASVEATKMPANEWGGWILRQSIYRCVAWTTVLRAVLLCDDDNASLRISNTELDGPLPCSEDLWSASESQWQTAPETVSSSLDCFARLLASTGLDDTISPFGLLTLISTVLFHICTLRFGSDARTMGFPAADEKTLSAALHTWEEAWRTHPYCSTVPEAPQGPLMADALVILNTAYYRLYANDQLNEMKALASTPDGQVSSAQMGRLYTLGHNPGLMKAIVRACRCLLVRVRLGMGFLTKTSCLNYPCYAPLAAFEGSLLMCWYLIGRRLAEIPGPEEAVVTTMMDEIVAESEYKYAAPTPRELLPIMIYRDMIRGRWVWSSTCNVIANSLDGMVSKLTPLLTRTVVEGT